MKKKSLLFAALIAMQAVSVQAAVGDQFVDDGLQFTVVTESESGNTVNVGHIDYDYTLSGDVVIPASITHDGTEYSVTALADNAFFLCTQITSVSLPATITQIGGDAFSGCNDLSAINVAADNAYFSSEDGILFNKDKTMLMACPKTKTGKYEVPQSVTQLWNHCFHSCRYLTEIVIHEGVNKIGTFAFWGCSSLTTMHIPSSASITVGSCLIGYCPSLESITVGENNTTVCSVDGVLYSKNMQQLNCYPPAKKGEIEIPESVKIFVNLCFSKNASLTSFNLPVHVTQLNSCPFAACENLTEFSVDEANPSYCAIDGVLFNKAATSLVQYPTGRTGKYEIPDGVTTIANGAFRGCRLSSVVVPASVTTLVNYSLAYNNLKSVKFMSSIPPTSISNTIFLQNPEDMVVYVPEGSLDAYQKAMPFVKNFEEFDDSAAIEEISSDSGKQINFNEPYEVFDVNGKKMSSDLQKLSPGIYLVRQKGHSSKFVIR